MFDLDNISKYMRFNYDNDHDILYIYLGDYKPSFSEEIETDVYVNVSEKDKSITGMIIVGYSKKNTEHLLRIIPVNINLEQLNELINLG